jgi:hypothetical protein
VTNEILTAEFEFERSTPRTFRWLEASDNPKIGILYIKKSVFKEQERPQKIKVTVTTIEG